MKFFVDANLPFKLAKNLKDKGFDVLHTDNLPNKEATSDKEIRELSVTQNRVLITKDSDFFDSHYLHRIPKKLIFVITGNIVNKELLLLFDEQFERIIKGDCIKKWT